MSEVLQTRNQPEQIVREAATPEVVNPMGTPGPRGPQGDQGEAGPGITVLGTLADVGDLPVDPVDGDAWWVGGVLWVASDDLWVESLDLTGPQGPAGPQGEPGEPGAGAVDSVNGEVGVVVLTATDVGALPATDPSVTNTRTPTAHAATHADGGSDEVTLAQSQVTGLVTSLAALLATADLPAGVAGLALTDFPAGLARDSEVAAAVADLVAAAPGTLDTLNELAAAIGDDPNFATTLATSLAAKVDKSTFDADTILKADTDNTPSALSVAASRIVGRKATGSIGALTAAEVIVILGLATVATSGSASDLASGTLPIARIADGTVTRVKADPDLSSGIPVLAEATADYTAVLGDAGSLKPINKATAVNWTIPPNSSVAYPVGTVLSAWAKGAGQVTTVAGAGVTIKTPAGPKSRVQDAQISAIKVATDTWLIGGDVTT